jgi:hypothetical protein
MPETPIKYQTNQSDSLKEAYIVNENSGGTVYTIKCQSSRDSLNKMISNYLIIDGWVDIDIYKIENIKKEIEKCYSNYGINPEINTCLMGTINGQISNDEAEELKKTVLNDNSISLVEGIRENNLESISAYSPYIDNYIISNNRKVNLNLALRYNKIEDKTYIWLATPVLNIEY